MADDGQSSPSATYPALWLSSELSDRPVTARTLARRLGWRIGTVRALLAVLESAGFASPDPFDGRKWTAGPGDLKASWRLYCGEVAS